MKTESTQRETEEYAERVLRALVATRETGEDLREQLASLVDLLATERFSTEEAQLFLKNAYEHYCSEHSAEFHRCLRLTTKNEKSYASFLRRWPYSWLLFPGSLFLRVNVRGEIRGKNDKERKHGFFRRS